MLDLRLWRHGPFARFFAGAALSNVGTWFNTVAVALLAFRLTGQIAPVATALAASVLPRLLLAPLAGALADRCERRALLIALDLASALVALAPLLVQQRALLPLLYAALVLLQAAGCLYRPAQSAYLAHLVPDPLIEGASAAYSLMFLSSMFVGPALAGLVVGTWGPAPGFLVNALSFLVSAGLLRTLPRAQPGRTPERLGRLLAGYVAVVRRHPRLGALCLCGLAATVPVFFLQGIMVAYAQALGQPGAFMGALYAAAGAGGALGGLAMGHLGRRVSPALCASLYVLSVPLLGLLALVRAAPLALGLLALSVAASTVGELLFMVGVQRQVAQVERGRAFGLLYWCFALGQVVGAGLGIVVGPGQAVAALGWISLGVLPVTGAGLLLFLRRAAPAMGSSSTAIPAGAS